jgi:hypothetical protein
MRNRIEKLLDMEVSNLIVFSAFWIMQKYRTPLLFARLLKVFFESTEFHHDSSPWLMEIGRNNGIYKVFKWLGWVSVNDSDPEYFWQHLVASPSYDSVIMTFPITMPLFREKFVRRSVREILQIA